MTMIKLIEKISMLPPGLQQEIFDFADFVLRKNQTKKKQSTNHLQFNWEGGLSGLKKKYTAVELQHQASKYRIEHAASD